MTACRSCSSYAATRSDLLCDGCGSAVDGGARLAGAYGVAFDPTEAGRACLAALGRAVEDPDRLPLDVVTEARGLLRWLDQNPTADPSGDGRAVAELVIRVAKEGRAR
jgi:hypothetical protein